MKEYIYKHLALVGWGCFLIKIGEDWPLPWVFLCPGVGLLALYCTLKVMGLGTRFIAPPSATGTLTGWIAPLLGYAFLLGVSRYLPPYWSQLCPLLAIVAIYCISRLWPDRKVEEKPEDALAEKNINQGV